MSEIQSVRCNGYFELCPKQLREHFITYAAKRHGSYHSELRLTDCCGREVTLTLTPLFYSSASQDYSAFT